MEPVDRARIIEEYNGKNKKIIKWLHTHAREHDQKPKKNIKLALDIGLLARRVRARDIPIDSEIEKLLKETIALQRLVYDDYRKKAHPRNEAAIAKAEKLGGYCERFENALEVLTEKTPTVGSPDPETDPSGYLAHLERCMPCRERGNASVQAPRHVNDSSFGSVWGLVSEEQEYTIVKRV